MLSIQHLAKLIIFSFIFTFSAFAMNTGELTRDLPFATLEQATAFVAQGNPITGAMVSDVIFNNNGAMIRILAQSPSFPLNRYPELIGSPMHDAISYNATGIIHFLVKEKEIKPTIHHIFTALSGFHHASLRALLAHKIDISGTNFCGKTAIQVAQGNADEISLKLLRDYHHARITQK